jgi:hypothetical protein
MSIQLTFCKHPKSSLERNVPLRALAVLALVITLSAAVHAQFPTGGNAFFGYSYARAQVFAVGSNKAINANGWEGSAEGKFLPWLGLVADLDWHYGGTDFVGCTRTPCTPQVFGANASRHNILFGPRASASLGRYTPFAEFLMGVAHQTNSGGGVSNSDTRLAVGFGGGVDYKLLNGVAWRVQADSIHDSLFRKAANNLRISTGIVFRF